MHTQILSGYFKGRRHLKDLGVDGNIIQYKIDICELLREEMDGGIF
jgi:hypothetical protein